MRNQPCYLSPDDPTAKLLRATIEAGVPAQLAGLVLLEFPRTPPIPKAVIQYTLGPLVVHADPKDDDLGWLGRDTTRKWRKRVDLERLEILCGQRPDAVSPTELMMVMHNAVMTARLAHEITQIYIWACKRALEGAGVDVNDAEYGPMPNPGAEPWPTDEQIFDGYLNHEYRLLCREIIHKVNRVAKAEFAQLHKELIADDPPAPPPEADVAE